MQCKSFYLSVCNEEGQAAGKQTGIADDSFSDCKMFSSEITKRTLAHRHANLV